MKFCISFTIFRYFCLAVPHLTCKEFLEHSVGLQMHLRKCSSDYALRRYGLIWMCRSYQYSNNRIFVKYLHDIADVISYRLHFQYCQSIHALPSYQFLGLSEFLHQPFICGKTALLIHKTHVAKYLCLLIYPTPRMGNLNLIESRVHGLHWHVRFYLFRTFLWCSRNAGQRTLGKDGEIGLPGGVRLYIVELPWKGRRPTG
jgi:hypothetical protein